MSKEDKEYMDSLIFCFGMAYNNLTEKGKDRLICLLLDGREDVE